MASNEETKITNYDAMQDIYNLINERAGTIDNQFLGISSTITDLGSSYWESDSASKFREKINPIITNLDGIVLELYGAANTLNTVLLNYQYVDEAAINSTNDINNYESKDYSYSAGSYLKSNIDKQ